MLTFQRLMLSTLCAVSIISAQSVVAADDGGTSIPPGSKVYIAEMDGFRGYLATALMDKHVPVVIVADREHADFAIDGTASEKKAGAAKVIFGSGLPEEDASITITNLKSGVIVLAASSHKGDAWSGKKSAASAIAKKVAKKVSEG